jgi:glycosyltransferase involved in cell wall biosynthesis
VKYKVKVTIGFCVKNNEATVKEAMESIVNQDFPHELMELIVVDGYSRDKTVSIVKEALLNSNIETKIFFENKGLGVARQMAVDNATGDYIIWADGDMVLAKDHVQKQVEFMEQNPSVGIAGGKFQMYPGENLVASLESLEWVVADYLHGRKASLKPILHRAGGCIYRVKAIREVGGLDCNIKGALEDLDAEYRIGEKGWLTFFVTDAVFHDRRKETWKAIWNENFWYGYGGHYFLHKHGKRVSTSAFLDGLRRVSVAYKLTYRKAVFLFLPQYFFKKMAWFLGFMKAHLDHYGHNFANVK